MMPTVQHLAWDAEALQRQLAPLLPGICVEVLGQVESTNTELLNRGRRSDDTRPSLLVAEHQTRGRGRHGRDWQSSPGASLTFSLALPLAPADWSALSLAVGVALADALEPLVDAAPPRIGLKWPNDLWLWEGPGRGRKLGGVLIETVQVGSRRWCVVGVGLNVLPQAVSGLPQAIAWLSELDTGASAPRVLAAVATPLARALTTFEYSGFAPFAAAFARRDLLAGQAVTTSGPAVLQGRADGVDDAGALRVHDGRVLHRVSSGEVSARLRAVDGEPC
jgi:BirA family biotin operon repressor/biotin-[acetyl-CoA-carboxylase] ligase